MKNWIITLAILITSIPLFGQDENCGFKTECSCDTTKKSLLESFENSYLVVHATVIKIDTLQISEIITPESVLAITQDTLNRSECAKEVLKTKKVLRTKISVTKSYKGADNQQEIYIITPLQELNCGFNEFILGESYVIFGTQNITADIYFLWPFDMDFFELREEYSFWTNRCKKTRLANEVELMQLEDLKKSLTKPKPQ